MIRTAHNHLLLSTLCVLTVANVSFMPSLSAMEQPPQQAAQTTPEQALATAVVALTQQLALQQAKATPEQSLATVLIKHPIAIAGVSGLAILTLYVLVPQTQGAIDSVCSWTGNKLYRLYHAIAYRVRVAPLLNQANALGQSNAEARELITQLENQQDLLTQETCRLQSEIKDATSERAQITVTAEHIAGFTGVVNGLGTRTGQLNNLASLGFNRCAQGFNQTSLILKAQHKELERLTAHIQRPLSLTVEEKRYVINFEGPVTQTIKDHAEKCSQVATELSTQTEVMVASAERLFELVQQLQASSKN